MRCISAANKPRNSRALARYLHRQYGSTVLLTYYVVVRYSHYIMTRQNTLYNIANLQDFILQVLRLHSATSRKINQIWSVYRLTNSVIPQAREVLAHSYSDTT